MSEDVLVTVECLVYNHSKYIRKTLDSILSQKTDFRFEILVHDDASTDGTQDIIMDYYKKYPDIIVPLLEKDNQFQSLGFVKMNEQKIYPYVKGKYFALCEGDDYWTDDHKLQKQISYLEANPECSYTFHNAEIVFANGEKKKRNVLPDISYNNKYWKDSDHRVDMPEIISLGFIPAASIVARSNFIINRRYFCEKPVCGDIPMRLSLALDGFGYYFNSVMSAYRTGNANSASGVARKSKDRYLDTIAGQVSILNAFDKYTHCEWHSEVMSDIRRRQIGAYMFLGDFRSIWSNPELRKDFLLRFNMRGKIHFLGKLILGNYYNRLRKYN